MAPKGLGFPPAQLVVVPRIVWHHQLLWHQQGYLQPQQLCRTGTPPRCFPIAGQGATSTQPQMSLAAVKET